MYIQVREARHLVCQADTMTDEMSICGKEEYTNKSLPLLLHQVRNKNFNHSIRSNCSHCGLGGKNQCLTDMRILFPKPTIYPAISFIQFYVDRIQELVQCKHMHMLRWARFCEHTKTIEALYPAYQERLRYIQYRYDFDKCSCAQFYISQGLLIGQASPGTIHQRIGAFA